jgi:hypothetical protein
LILQHVRGRSGGWRRLAERYSAGHEPEGATSSGHTLEVGHVLYKNCVRVGVGERGLYLAVSSPLGLLGRLPPLAIPWSDLVPVGEGRIYWQKAVIVSVGHPEVATITLPLRLFQTLQPHLGRPSGG